MIDIYIFNQHEQPLTVISEDTGLVEAPFRIEVNGVPTEPFSFTVEADQPVAEHVKEENKVVFKDHEGDWRLMTIKEVDDSNDIDGPTTIATCEPTFLAELNDHIVVDRRFVEQTADVALAAAVNGTRWQASVEVELGRATTNFYYISSTEAIWKTIETWGGEFKDTVEFDEETNEITGSYVKIIQRLGTEQGQRFEIDHNTTEIGRTVLSYPKTALYGRGASLEIEDEDGEHTGGYTRYIDFADVEWKKSNGDPVDKPLGQEWVGDPEALLTYGYENGFRHREGIFSNRDYEDPAELLQATWEALQNAKKPEVNYRLSAQLFNEKVSLGDTSQAIDRRFARPIEIQARVIAMEYDLMDIEGTMVIEMGQFLDLGANRIDDLEREVEEIKNRPPPPARIDEGSYPNIKPGTPINVEAYGGMEVIQLYWEYASQIYVKQYEVYGSRTEDFIPDSQHLLWRGNTSAFSHTVGTDEVWYYRIRAVNYHGTPSDWSEQVRAATHRVISDDILWGPELAERMRELHRISDIIGENGVNFDQISQEAKDLINRQARIYTDEEIQATRDGIMDELDIRTDDLYDSVADLNQRAQDLINRADNVDDILYDYNVRIDETERGLEFKADSLEVDLINRTVEGHTTEIEILAEGLSSKVSETFVRDAIDGIEIGGRNLVTNSKTEWTTVTISQFGYSGMLTLPIDGDKVKHGDTVTFSVDVTDIPNGESVYARLDWYEDGNVYTSVTNSAGRISSNGRIHITGTIPNDTRWTRVRVRIMPFQWSINYQVKYRHEQIEIGNKATDWSLAPEDILSVQENHSTLIEQNSRAISLQAESIIDLDGLISDAQAAINVLSNEISQRVTETIFNEETGDLRQSISNVQQLAEGIEQTVSNIEIGGRNLIRNSKGNTLDGWYHWHSSQYLDITNRLGYDWIWARKPPTNATMGVHTPTFNLKANKTYICSFLIRSLSNSGYDLNYLYLRQGENTITTIKSLPNINMRSGFEGDIAGDGLRVWFTFNHSEDVTDARLLLAIRDRPDGAGFIIREIKISEGNILTDWNPAPEDVDQRMTIAESTIRQLSDDITLKVDVDSIVSEININREGIRLSGALIHLNGLSLIDEAIIQTVHIADGAIERAKLGTAVIGTAQIENGAITNAKIGNLSADKINAGSLRGIDVYGARFRSSNGNNWMEIVGGDIHLEQSNGRYMDVGPSGLYGYNAGGSVRFQADQSLVTSAALGTSNLNVYLAAGDGGQLGEVRAVRRDTIPGGGSATDYSYINVRTRAIKSPPTANAYVGTDGELRVMSEGLTNGGIYRWVRSAGYYGNTLEVNGGNILYLRASDRIRTMGTGSSGAYIDLQTNYVYARSIITNSELTANNFYIGMDGELRAMSRDLSSTYRNIRGNGFYGNFVDVNNAMNLYLRPASGGEVQITTSGSTSNFTDIRGRAFFGTNVTLSGSFSENTHFHVRPAANGEVRITSRSDFGTFRPIRATDYLPPSSTRESKKHINVFNVSTLDTFRSSNVYQFLYKWQDDEEKLRLGVMLDEVPDCIVAPTGDTLELYSTVGYLWKGLKDVVNYLDGEINWQRIEYQVLKNRVSKLEERIEELEEMVV